MPIDAKKYVLTALTTNPGELPDIMAGAWTTLKFRFIKRCTGKRTIVRRKTCILNSRNVHIGDDCILQDHVYIRAGARGNIIIGNHCMINSFCRFFGHGGIEINDYSQFGPGVTVTTTSHDYNTQDFEESFKKVTIGKRVWIGANAIILPGVTVGDNTIVGAGSVVTGDLPPNSIAVGAPAKVIKSVDNISETKV